MEGGVKWTLMLRIGVIARAQQPLQIWMSDLHSAEDDGVSTTLSMPICSLSTNLAPVMVHSNT